MVQFNSVPENFTKEMVHFNSVPENVVINENSVEFTFYKQVNF